MKENTKFSYWMSTPTFIILAFITAFPICYALWNSFTDYYYLTNAPKNFVGLENYIGIIKDSYFRQAVFNTLKFMVLAVIFETGLGIGFAVLVNSFKKGGVVLRILILLPNLLPPVTTALIWQMMLSNHNGIINEILIFFNGVTVNWLTDIKTAFYAILVIDIWQWTPFAFLLIYATLQGVPEAQYEASQIDGAGKFKQFIYITLPHISSTIVLVMLLRTIDSLRLFDKVNILTKGGPANSTATITQYIYLHGVKNLKIGYGAAASIIMTVLVMGIAVIYVKSAFRNQYE